MRVVNTIKSIGKPEVNFTFDHIQKFRRAKMVPSVEEQTRDSNI